MLLEGGCGDGRYVRYFTDLGVKTIGVDFAQTTVQMINEYLPNLDVRVGDIRHFEFPDGHFDAYYSGGVIEHFEDGVDPQLSEANRVLKEGGYFFVTVPHMNIARRCAGFLAKRREKIDLDGRKSCHIDGVSGFMVALPPLGYHFHEYCFSSNEMHLFLKRHGFAIIAEMCFSVSFGLYDIEWYRRLAGADKKHRTIVNRMFALPHWVMRNIEASNQFFSSTCTNAIGMIFGNLKLYICRKKDGPSLRP